MNDTISAAETTCDECGAQPGHPCGVWCTGPAAHANEQEDREATPGRTLGSMTETELLTHAIGQVRHLVEYANRVRTVAAIREDHMAETILGAYEGAITAALAVARMKADETAAREEAARTDLDAARATLEDIAGTARRAFTQAEIDRFN